MALLPPNPHEQALPSELPLLGLSGPHTADSRPTQNTSSQPLQGPPKSLLCAGCGGHCRQNLAQLVEGQAGRASWRKTCLSKG